MQNVSWPVSVGAWALVTADLISGVAALGSLFAFRYNAWAIFIAGPIFAGCIYATKLFANRHFRD